MGIMVSLSWVTTGGFAVMALLCASVFLGMRRLTSLAWLTATVTSATLQTVFLANAESETVSSVVVSVLTPLAYLCYGQTVRAALGQKHQNWRLYGVIAVLVAINVVMKFYDVAFVYRTLPFQLACALALGDSLQRLYVHKGKEWLDRTLFVVVTGVAALFVFRFFTYPFLFPADMAYAELRRTPYEAGTLILSAVFSVPAVLLLLARIIGSVIANYRQRSESDGLTGLYNHQALHQIGAAPSKTGGSVIFCDIDLFKSVNDAFGHPAGDRVLCAFADLLRASGHTAGRVGGEEFAVILQSLAGGEAMAVAERVRRRFYDASHAGLPSEQRVSASFGIASYGPGESPASAFVRADRALYQAKTAGRNRVVLAVSDTHGDSKAA